jgi:predicted ATPase
LLSEDEQVLLRRLAIFAGSFSLTSAEQVCADERLASQNVLDCLGRLADKSLVQVERAGSRSRYRLLETIRQFARERLIATGEVEVLEAKHCRHFLDLARDHDPERPAGVVVERPQLLDADHDNPRRARLLLRNDHERALSLGVSLWPYWLARGHFVEGAGLLESVLGWQSHRHRSGAGRCSPQSSMGAEAWVTDWQASATLVSLSQAVR